MNLRETKKLRTRQAISDAAINLMLDNGFDQVSITQIAEAAEVSRRTLFAYFPTKEDLVMHLLADHETEMARAVRASDDPPLETLRKQYLDGLARHDPITGLFDGGRTGALYRLLLETPALRNRMLQFFDTGERELALALREKCDADPLVAEYAAAQIVGVRRRMVQENYEALVAGMTADERYPAAVKAAELAFDLLAGGLAGAGFA